MTSWSFFPRHPNPRSSPTHLDLPDISGSRAIPNFMPPRLPSHGASFPAVEILKPGRVRLLLRAVESSSRNLGWKSGLVDEDDEEDGLCPVDCVKEFKTEEEFSRILEKAKGTNSLVVVDFYRTSCGSCKYIEQGFTKLCKGSGDGKDSVVFLKHNVIDEYDEQSEVAERLRIKDVWMIILIERTGSSCSTRVPNSRKPGWTNWECWNLDRAAWFLEFGSYGVLADFNVSVLTGWELHLYSLCISFKGSDHGF